MAPAKKRSQNPVPGSLWQSAAAHRPAFCTVRRGVLPRKVTRSSLRKRKLLHLIASAVCPFSLSFRTPTRCSTSDHKGEESLAYAVHPYHSDRARGDRPWADTYAATFAFRRFAHGQATIRQNPAGAPIHRSARGSGGGTHGPLSVSKIRPPRRRRRPMP